MSSVNFQLRKLSTTGSESAVLKIVRDFCPISRSRVAELSEMAVQAVSRTVSPLIDRGILIEVPLADTTGQRRKAGLCLSPSAGHCVAVTYNGEGLDGCILDSAYNVRAQLTRAVPLRSASQEAVLREIVSFVKELRTHAPKDAGKCLALVAVDPGTVDTQNGIALKCSLLDDWNEVPVRSILEKKFKLPVIVTTGSLADIHAVDRLELKGSTENVIFVRYCQGVGCSLKLQGQYIHGKAGLAGEFGHLVVTDEPVPCRCGYKGCLEAVSALPALARNARLALEQSDSLSVLAQKEIIDGTEVIQAAAEGDRLALRIVSEAFGYLGRAVGGLANIVAPEIILFDNAIATAGQQAVASLVQAVQESTLPSHLNNMDIRISNLDTNITSLGGAAIGMDRCLAC